MTDEQVRREACPSELSSSMYADGELFGSEAREFEDHLNRCPRCRNLVHAFKMERDALVGVLDDTEAFLAESKPAHAPSPVHALILMGLVMVFAALLRFRFGLTMGLELPWGMEWLSPLSITGQLSLAFSSGFYFIQEGGSIMESLVSGAGVAALAVMLLYTVFVLLRRSPRVSKLLGCLVLAAGLSAPAEAIETRSIENVSIEADEIIDDTLIVFGRTARIDGVVTGDLIVFAQSIEIAGSVHGDVFSFGRNVEIDGEVGGGIAGFGQVIRIGDSVGQSVFCFGQSMLSRRDASIEGDFFAFGEDINVGGAVGRNVTAFGNTLTVTGEVGRDVTFSGSLAAVHSSASIGGNLDVDLPDGENLQLDSTASVAGETIVGVPEPDQDEDETLSVWTFVRMVLWLAAAFITGMLLLWAVPALRRVPLDGLRAMLLSVGVGSLVLIVVPIAAVLLCVTLIGLPAGLVMGAVYVLGLYVSKIVVAHFLGNALLRPKGQDTGSMALPLLVGLVLVLIAVSLPYIGWVVNLLLVIIGLGAMGLVLFRSARSRMAVA